MRKTYTDEELINIAKEYEEHFTTFRAWDSFAKHNGLPRSITYKKRFGTWNEAKQAANISYQDKGRTYSKQEIIELIKKHEDIFTSSNIQEKWNEFRKGKELPSYQTIISYISYAEIRKLFKTTDYQKNRHLSNNKQVLLDIAIKHHKYFKQKRKWDEYAKENQLPSSNVYIYHFGKWSTIKRKVNEYLRDNFP